MSLPVGNLSRQRLSARNFPASAEVTLSYVQTQSLSQKAPPAVWNLAISNQTPLYPTLEKLGDGVGNLHWPADATSIEEKMARVAMANVVMFLMIIRILNY